MTILQFIWQIILICGLVIGLAVGLFSSPWYVLCGILVATFLLTWRLMPTQETHLAQFVDTFNELQQGHSVSNQAESLASSTPQVSDHDSATATLNAASPAVLSYRGAPYPVQSQSTNTVAEEKPEPSLELKYRGAKVKLNHH